MISRDSTLDVSVLNPAFAFIRAAFIVANLQLITLARIYLSVNIYFQIVANRILLIASFRRIHCSPVLAGGEHCFSIQVPTKTFDSLEIGFYFAIIFQIREILV